MCPKQKVPKKKIIGGEGKRGTVQYSSVVQKIELRVSNHAPHTRYACGLLGLFCLFDAAAGFLLVQLARHHQATSWTQLTRVCNVLVCRGWLAGIN